MPANTTRGFPYMLGTDALGTVATAMQNLAQAVQDLCGISKAGTVNSGALVAATTKTVAVAFATPFPVGTTPRVVATIVGGQGTALATVTVASVTNAGFNMLFRRETSTVALDADWQALLI